MTRNLVELDQAECAPVGARDALAASRPVSSQLIRVVWTALERGQIDPATAIRELQAGLTGGVAAVLPFTRHPVAAVRLEAIGAAASCGHPGVIEEVDQLPPAKNPVPPAWAIKSRGRRREPAALTFRLLGCFSVTRGTWRADDAAWERRVAQRVVRFLLLQRDRLVSEDELLEAFWPDGRCDKARRSLHVAISRARRVLDTPDSPSVIEVTERAYRLQLRARDAVDADEFETTALAALAQPGMSRLGALERAASLWGGEPLPEERYSDWALGWRERLTDLYAALLAALADSCLERGDLIGAGLRARDLVGLDALNEGGHRRLMLTYARSGRRSQALRQFLACRRALVEQLGVEPATETISLQQRILAGEPV